MLTRVSTTHAREQLDAVTYLTVYLVALLAIESRLVVGPLGGAGQPAQLLGLLGLGWWMFHQVQRSVSRSWQVHPVRIALLALFLTILGSYAASMSRPIDADEASSATLGLVGLLGWLGVALLAHDGIPSHQRFEVLVRRMILGATLLSLLGVAQFVLHDTLIRAVTIPGLRPNVPLGDLLSRSGFTRPSATALHPIEFGMVLTTILPLAVSRARTLTEGRFWGWFSVFTILLGIVVSGSRSAVLCTVVGMAVLAAAWAPRTRAMAMVFAAGLFAFVYVAMPGVTGNLVKLFTGFGDDGSVRSRTGSYTLVGEFFGRQPWLGRGYSTFLPSYRILDNAYLLMLVEVGLLGLLTFVGVLATAFYCARAARVLSRDAAAAERSQGLGAAVSAAAAGFATFDGLSFPMGAGILFLVIGMAGASYRLARAPRAARAPTTLFVVQVTAAEGRPSGTRFWKSGSTRVVPPPK